jgi:hypothetical protein
MLHLVLLVFAFVLFILATAEVPSRFNLVAAGLAFLTAAMLFPIR